MTAAANVAMGLAASAEAYVRHLEAEGKSPSTCGTTKRTLALLVAHLGAERDVSEIMVEDLDRFFVSEAATKQRGKPRAAASVAQLQRIVRAAFAWWHKQGERIAAPANRKQPAGTAPPSTPPIGPSASAAAPAAVPASTPTRAARPQLSTAAPVAALPASTPARAAFLDLTYQGQPVRFAKTEIDRSRLHGVRKLVALDSEGRECQSALLTRDERYVLPTGSTADLYINECGDAVARRELVAADQVGLPRSTLAPATNDSWEIVGPLAAGELLDCAVTRVYSLLPVAVPAKLAQALGAGALFRVPYRPRASATEMPAFLLAGESGAFLILAEPHGFDFVGPEQPVLPDNDPDDDDIDAFAFPDHLGDPHVPA